MSRTNVTRPQPSTPAEPVADLPAVLEAATAAARASDREEFNVRAAAARAGGASVTQIVAAYAEGGLQRLEQGLPVISFRWTGEPH